MVGACPRRGGRATRAAPAGEAVPRHPSVFRRLPSVYCPPLFGMRELESRQLRIRAASLQKLGMRSPLDNAPFIDDEDLAADLKNRPSALPSLSGPLAFHRTCGMEQGAREEAKQAYEELVAPAGHYEQVAAP